MQVKYNILVGGRESTAGGLSPKFYTGQNGAHSLNQIAPRISQLPLEELIIVFMSYNMLFRCHVAW